MKRSLGFGLLATLGALACAKDPATQAGVTGTGTGGNSAPGTGGQTQMGTGCISGGAGGMGGGDVTVSALPWLHVEGNRVKDPSGNNVVLRGVAFPDLGELQGNEGGINAMIDRVTNANDTQGGCSAAWATRVIRVAVSPSDGGVTTPTQYKPGENYYDTILRPTVDHARARGLYVIIDWHYVDTTTLHEATTTAFWTEMAPHFAADSNVLFELYNEPINDGSWTTVKPDMQMWYDLVRAAAPDNLVLVGTPNWCQYVGTAAASPITGTNVGYVAHMYPQHWAQPSLRSQITSAAALVPVFVTEWGFEQSTTAILNGTITSYGLPFKQFIQQAGVSWTGWCASASWRPTMFNGDFSLRSGDTAMGGFTKDWLYEQRIANQPQP